MESKQLWKNRQSHSEVRMCGMSNQQWPSTEITLIERKRQSAWLDAVTIQVDKKRVNYFVLKHLFWRSSATKNSPRKHDNALSDALLMSRFQNFPAGTFDGAVQNNARRGFLKPCFAQFQFFIHSFGAKDSEKLFASLDTDTRTRKHVTQHITCISVSWQSLTGSKDLNKRFHKAKGWKEGQNAVQKAELH